MNSPIPLSDQLAAAARTLLAVEQGRSLTDVLAKTPARLRPGVQALAFHALRHWGEAGVLIGLLAERPPEGAARALLGLALTLLLPQAVGGNVSYADSAPQQAWERIDHIETMRVPYDYPLPPGADGWRLDTAYELGHAYLRELTDAGISAGVLMAPIVPGFSSSRGKLERTVKAIADPPDEGRAAASRSTR